MKPQASPGTGYRADIDGLRAVAVVSVMAYHLEAAWLPGGFTGVDVFFVISGFVVTASLAGSRATSLPAFISEFYARRLARILPALVVMLVVAAAAATALIPPAWLSQLSEDTAVSAFFGLSNFVLQGNSDTYFSPRAEFNPYTHTWSLGVEEQFYVLAPLLVFFWLRAVAGARPRQRRVSMAALVLLVAASLGACVWATAARPSVAFYSILCRFWELGSGALLFMLRYRGAAASAPQPARSREGIGAVAGLLLVGAGFAFAEPQRFPWPWVALPVLGTLALIGGPHAEARDGVRRALASRPAVWVGKRSYSLYLWHWPVYVLLRWTAGLDSAAVGVAALALTLALATASYRWVEQPLRHAPWIESRPKLFRVAGFALLPIAGYLAATHLFEQRERYTLSSVVRARSDWYVHGRMPRHLAGERACAVETAWLPFSGGGERRFTPGKCEIAPGAHKVFVIGDSHAGAMSPMLEQYSARQGVVVALFLCPGCSYVNLLAPMNSQRPDCTDFNQAALTRAVERGGRGDVVMLASLRLKRYVDQWASMNVPDMKAHMYGPQALQARGAALIDAPPWIRPFADRGMNVVFSAPIPIFKSPPFRCADWFNKMNSICAGGNEQPRAELEALRAPVLEGMQSIAAAIPGVSIWDPFDALCPGSVCRTHAEGRPLFFDGDHLSAYGNFKLYESFERFLHRLVVAPAASPRPAPQR